MSDEGEKKFGEIISKCWKDSAFKKRFLSDPKGVLKEHAIEIPPNVQVKVVENTADQLYITLPPSPQASGREMSDAQLDQVSGGTLTLSSSTLSFARLIVSTQSGSSGSTCYKDCIPW
jgi:hypothetical protein